MPAPGTRFGAGISFAAFTSKIAPLEVHQRRSWSSTHKPSRIASDVGCTLPCPSGADGTTKPRVFVTLHEGLQFTGLQSEAFFPMMKLLGGYGLPHATVAIQQLWGYTTAIQAQSQMVRRFCGSAPFDRLQFRCWFQLSLSLVSFI